MKRFRYLASGYDVPCDECLFIHSNKELCRAREHMKESFFYDCFTYQFKDKSEHQEILFIIV